eukprot:142910_1
MPSPTSTSTSRKSIDKHKLKHKEDNYHCNKFNNNHSVTGELFRSSSIRIDYKFTNDPSKKYLFVTMSIQNKSNANLYDINIVLFKNKESLSQTPALWSMKKKISCIDINKYEKIIKINKNIYMNNKHKIKIQVIYNDTASKVFSVKIPHI